MKGARGSADRSEGSGLVPLARSPQIKWIKCICNARISQKHWDSQLKEPLAGQRTESRLNHINYNLFTLSNVQSCWIQNDGLVVFCLHNSFCVWR